jgi:hypothetical protein
MNRYGLAVLTIGVAAVVGLGGGTVLASPQQTPAQQAATLAATWNIDRDDSQAWSLAALVRVVGFVWTDQDRPVPYPRLVI